MNPFLKTPVVIVFCSLVVVAGCNFERRLNQRAAIASMKQVREGEKSFKSRNGYYGSLEELARANLVDPTLANGIKDGYRFTLRAHGQTFEASAIPLEYSKTGVLALYLNESGVIRGSGNNGKEANSNDDPIVER